VQVGVLLEGWSAPRCKLLIDLAPSLSLVRATQKFFRVMTRLGDQEARIYLLIPAEIPVMPVLPTEVFGGSDAADYLCGDLVAADASSSTRPALQVAEACPVAGVRLRKRVVFASHFSKPALDPRLPDQVRAVMETCPDWNPTVPCSLQRFRWLFFQHELFVGRGDFLLRWLGVSRTAIGYTRFVTRLYPEVAALRWLGPLAGQDIWCSEEATMLEQSLLNAARSGKPRPELVSAWEAVAGIERHRSKCPEKCCVQAEERAALVAIVQRLSRRRHDTVMRFFGLDGAAEQSADDLAQARGVSYTRVRQIIGQAVRRLQSGCRRDQDNSLYWRFLGT
jgi:hypothetical protein